MSGNRATGSMIASIQRLTAEEKSLAQGGKNSTAYLEERRDIDDQDRAGH